MNRENIELAVSVLEIGIATLAVVGGLVGVLAFNSGAAVAVLASGLMILAIKLRDR